VRVGMDEEVGLASWGVWRELKMFEDFGEER